MENKIDELPENLLYDNKNFFQNLFYENLNRKEKDYLLYKDLKQIEQIEINLLKLVESLPSDLMVKLNKDLNN